MKLFHIVYNSDNNFMLPTVVSAASALYHAVDPTRLSIDVLDCGISDDVWSRWETLLRQRFPNAGGIVRIRVETKKLAQFRSWKGSFATYARILTPELLPDLNMCLFMDGDTLFVSDPLELERAFDDRYWIQGSVDYTPDEGRAREKEYAEYGLQVAHPYVCCGLMLMNLKVLRENQFSAKCFEFLKRYNALLSVDQEAINSVANGHVAVLDQAWGVFNACGFAEIKHPKALHYVNGKPWQLNFNWTHCIYDFECAWFVYARHLLGLSWSDFPEAKLLEYFNRKICTKLMEWQKRFVGDKSWFERYFSVLPFPPIREGAE